MGSRTYCISSIIDDLKNKMNMLYTAEQLFFLADKENKVTDEALQFLDDINDARLDAGETDNHKRAELLKSFFIKEKVEFVLSCLIAYEKPSIYKDEQSVKCNMVTEIQRIVDKFDTEFESLVDIPYSVLILMVPIRELKTLRESVLS